MASQITTIDCVVAEKELKECSDNRESAFAGLLTTIGLWTVSKSYPGTFVARMFESFGVIRHENFDGWPSLWNADQPPLLNRLSYSKHFPCICCGRLHAGIWVAWWNKLVVVDFAREQHLCRIQRRQFAPQTAYWNQAMLRWCPSKHPSSAGQQWRLQNSKECVLLKQISEWGCHRRVIGDETTIIAGEFEKSSKLLQWIRKRPIPDCCNLVRIHCYHLAGESML